MSTQPEDTMMEEPRATILVVDDEESIRDILSRRLQEEGYTCETAASGKEALWKSFMQDFDLVLTDIKMPGMSGMEVLSQVISDHPDTSVVMLTAVAETHTAVEAMKIGAYDYVTKPFNLEDLVMRVQRSLERRRLVLENREYQLHLQQKVERQVGQMQQYYQEAIEALSREESILEELNALRASDRKEGDADKTSAMDTNMASNLVRSFAKRLTSLVNLEELGPSDAQEESLWVPEAEPRSEQEPGSGGETKYRGTTDDQSRVLYRGIIELAILPPVDLHKMVDLYEQLNNTRGINVSNIGGSAKRGITIRLLLEQPTALMQVLREQPEVQRAADEDPEHRETVPSRKGEHPPIRRIMLEISTAPTSRHSS